MYGNKSRSAAGFYSKEIPTDAVSVGIIIGDQIFMEVKNSSSCV